MPCVISVAPSRGATLQDSAMQLCVFTFLIHTLFSSAYGAYGPQHFAASCDCAGDLRDQNHHFFAMSFRLSLATAYAATVRSTAAERSRRPTISGRRVPGNAQVSSASG